MKIVYLNAWDGESRSEITKYLQTQASTTDVFCFQEAFDNMKALCNDILVDYTAYIDEKTSTGREGTFTFCQATYIRKEITVTSSGSILQGQPDCGLGTYIEIAQEEKRTFICNFHGMSRPVDKLDNPSRLLQSQMLIDCFKDKERVVIGGDFNSFPETENIGMFAEAGYRDLIKEFAIKTTRNRLVWERYPDTKQYYSDYIFIAPGVTLQEFIVPNNEASDHLPLELTIE